jgi:hypothetical protein
MGTVAEFLTMGTGAMPPKERKLRLGSKVLYLFIQFDRGYDA